MSADWFYMSTGFFGGHKTVGPISEIDLMKKIETGKVTQRPWCRVHRKRMVIG